MNGIHPINRPESVEWGGMRFVSWMLKGEWKY